MNGFTDHQDNYGRPGCTEWVECIDCHACFESEGDRVCEHCQFDREHPIDPAFRARMLRAFTNGPVSS